MKCCFEDCPDYSPDAREMEYCIACDREYLLLHVGNSIAEIDRAVEVVDWRFCITALRTMAPTNHELQRMRALFEQIESARNELKQLVGVEQV